MGVTPTLHHLSHQFCLSRLTWFFYFSDTYLILDWLLYHLLFLIINLPSKRVLKNIMFCVSWLWWLPLLWWPHRLLISLNRVSQLQIFIIIIAPFWFPELTTVLTLFKIFLHASPLKYNLFSCYSIVNDTSIFFICQSP